MMVFLTPLATVECGAHLPYVGPTCHPLLFSFCFSCEPYPFLTSDGGWRGSQADSGAGPAGARSRPNAPASRCCLIRLCRRSTAATGRLRRPPLTCAASAGARSCASRPSLPRLLLAPSPSPADHSPLPRLASVLRLLLAPAPPARPPLRLLCSARGRPSPLASIEVHPRCPPLPTLPHRRTQDGADGEKKICENFTNHLRVRSRPGAPPSP